VAKKQTFADKAQKAKKHGLKTHDGEDILQVVKVRTFVEDGGSLKMVTKTVKITAKNQSQHYGG
jgi:hypothetical protein